MTNSATLSEKFKITISRSVCAALDWKPVRRLAFVPKGSCATLAGIAKGANPGNYRDRGECA
jgi:hypothetical protein